MALPELCTSCLQACTVLGVYGLSDDWVLTKCCLAVVVDVWP